MNNENSKKLYEKACNLMPGGVNSPVRAFRSVGGNPVFFKFGKGSHLIDVDGNEYIDYCMSWGPLILGHADNDVVKAIQKASENGTSFGAPHEDEITIAQMIVDSLKSIEKVRLVNSGTEATMSAIRLARGYTGKSKIIKFDGCYHGHADHLLVAAGSGLATFGVPDSAGVPESVAMDTIVVKYNDIKELEDILKKHSNEIACCIVEPVCCNYGLVMPNEDYLQNVRELCTKYNVLLIFDEVITGFRLAKGGAQEKYSVYADITTLGKIIGGGLPVGAYGASSEIMLSVSPDGPVYQAGTLSGNPIAVAAGIATLSKLNTSLYHQIDSLGQYFEENVNKIISKYDEILFVRLNSIFIFYFTKEKKITNVEMVKDCNMQLFAKFHNEMLNKGIYLSPSGYEVGFLSSSHTKEDIDKTLQAIEDSLNNIF